MKSFLLLTVLLATPLLALYGQVDTSDRSLIDRVGLLIERAEYDSARLLPQPLYQRLAAEEQLDVPVGLELRLHLARIEEREHNFVEAVHQLLPLIDAAKQRQLPSPLIRAYLLMALVYEQQDRPERCHAYLQRAEQLVARHGLDALRPRLMNRYSSYERLFGISDRALAYARRAVDYARRYQQPLEQATGHLLLSLITRYSDPADSQRQLTAAAELYRVHGGSVDYFFVLANLNHLQLASGDYGRALVTNTTALHYLDSLLLTHREISRFRGTVYGLRSRILRTLGQYDSAFHYLELAHKGDLETVRENAAERVAAVEAQYAKARDRQLIATQQTLLENRDRRQFWLSLVGATILVALAILFYYNRKLRRYNRVLGEQSKLLQDRNDKLAVSLHNEQLLQGEVHHRVKNNLQIIVGLLDRQMEDLTDPAARAALDAMAGRVYSMAAVHQTLYQEGRVGEVNFLTYTRRLTQHLTELSAGTTAPAYTFDIVEAWFDLETAVPMGTILNELLTNSFKYATTAGVGLRIHIALTEGEDGYYTLTYRDNGPGYSFGMLQEREGGLGSYLLDGMSRQLDGFVVTENCDGAVCRIRFRKKQTRVATRSSTPNRNLPISPEAVDTG